MGCSTESEGRGHRGTERPDDSADLPGDGPADDVGEDAPSGRPSSGPAGEALTYWDDMVPIFEPHCMSCHREGGSGPFRLDQYASAKAHASAIVRATKARTMPPSYILADGTCGEFADINQLSDAQIARIERWAAAGAPEGKARKLQLAEPVTLRGGSEYVTPPYTPVAIGGALAATDDYHCFAFDPQIDKEQFITGFDVEPGAGNVHHVIGYLVDPEAPSLIPGLNNGEMMALEDANSPLVPGWSCLMNAGDMVAAKDMRATWLPGQNAQRLPNASGVRIRPTDKIIVQVHYSLSGGDHAASHGTSAANVVTKMRFEYAETVENEGFFIAGDGLLDTLAQPVPLALAPGKKAEPFRWSRKLRELNWTRPQAELWGIYPHMHQLGATYAARLDTPEDTDRCIAQLPRWNYHWQRMYSYAKPTIVTPDTTLHVTCGFDTTSQTLPVLPGMGTQNEMCAAFLYVTVPSR